MSKTPKFLAWLAGASLPAAAWAVAPEAVVPALGDVGLLTFGAVLALGGTVFLMRRRRSQSSKGERSKPPSV